MIGARTRVALKFCVAAGGLVLVKLSGDDLRPALDCSSRSCLQLCVIETRTTSSSRGFWTLLQYEFVIAQPLTAVYEPEPCPCLYL
jgi:hypothetical protein